MKAYNKYMDKITVSNTLHDKIMSRIEARPKHWPIMIKRSTAVFACLALVLLGVFTISKLTPTPGNNPSVIEPGTITSETDSSSKYTLYFNKADSQSTTKSDIAIPGQFWQELTDEELKAIFPRLTEMHTVTATANFQSDESRASLFNIDAQAVSSAGLKTYIQLAPGEVVLDYGFDAETKALIDELTLDTVRARSYEVSDSGDEQGHRMRFSVLYQNVLVELSVKGVSPEAVFEILQQIKK
jgi:hypothetical protein